MINIIYSETTILLTRVLQTVYYLYRYQAMYAFEPVQ